MWLNNINMSLEILRIPLYTSQYLHLNLNYFTSLMFPLEWVPKNQLDFMTMLDAWISIKNLCYELIETQTWSRTRMFCSYKSNTRVDIINCANVRMERIYYKQQFNGFLLCRDRALKNIELETSLVHCRAKPVTILTIQTTTSISIRDIFSSIYFDTFPVTTCTVPSLTHRHMSSTGKIHPFYIPIPHKYRRNTQINKRIGLKRVCRCKN